VEAAPAAGVLLTVSFHATIIGRAVGPRHGSPAALLDEKGEFHMEKDPKNPRVDQSEYNELPSKVTDSYWIYTGRQKGSYPATTTRSGKWLLFIPVEKIDSVWAVIKTATEEGRLGQRSKVATMRPNPNARNPGVKVICVYTYDSEDATDVRRIRQALSELGFTEKISYKTDSDTMAGKYSHSGAKNISKYYE
jgi:hypothetical protein